MTLAPAHTLYIKNLNDKIQRDRLTESLYTLFSTYGKVVDIVTGKARKLRGQAWIVYEDLSSASLALRQVQNLSFYEKPMVIEYAKTKSDVIAKKEGVFIPREKRKVNTTTSSSTVVSGTKKMNKKVKMTASALVRNEVNKILFLEAFKSYEGEYQFK